MAANINVDWNELNLKSSDMKEEASNLRSAVDSIQRQVKSLGDSWQSDASERMISIMNDMTPVFERFESVVKEYGAFLENTARIYSETEGNINKATNALNFK
ncbi:WXG100 family type VII secretion target [Eshraghiella crossota]|uniref:WXG100 family type VII secretion target n=1 Tax=Eshraghiella crossota TaxID=45851 RepID=UPI004027FEED